MLKCERNFLSVLFIFVILITMHFIDHCSRLPSSFGALLPRETGCQGVCLFWATVSISKQKLNANLSGRLYIYIFFYFVR